jgi:hypothetical protein
MLTVPGNPACSCEHPNASAGELKSVVLAADRFTDGRRDQSVSDKGKVRAVLLE